MIQTIKKTVLTFLLLILLPLHCEEEDHSINFNDIPVVEFIRYVSKICEVNFIFNHQDLEFNVTLSSGKPVSSADVLKALFKILKSHGFSVVKQQGYFVVHPIGEEPEEYIQGQAHVDPENKKINFFSDEENPSRYEFYVHKLQYHEGGEIQEAVRKIAADLRAQGDIPIKVIKAIDSIQWIKATNSLIYSGDSQSDKMIRKLLSKLDAPLRQVFIEVLVIETDVRKSSEFGLQWAAGGQLNNKVGFGMGNFPKNGDVPPFAGAMQGVNASNTPSGLAQIPIGSGFDLGVIGDIIMHRGKSYLSLGSLVSALQVDGDSTIVLNQKIITQDNKHSTIFVGDNIPFTGSVVSTVGQSQQTTSNIEYRDIGVNLKITPRLGDGDIITLDLDQEISESLTNLNTPNTAQVNGIRTTKTNMMTHVHVPDQHFLVLSGMIRNSKANHKAGLPCLGGLPFIGAAFSKTMRQDEKRNVIIFVRPHIVRSMDEYKEVSEKQEEIFEKQADRDDFAEALKIFRE